MSTTVMGSPVIVQRLTAACFACGAGKCCRMGGPSACLVVGCKLPAQGRRPGAGSGGEGRRGGLTLTRRGHRPGDQRLGPRRRASGLLLRRGAVTARDLRRRRRHLDAIAWAWQRARWPQLADVGDSGGQGEQVGSPTAGNSTTPSVQGARGRSCRRLEPTPTPGRCGAGMPITRRQAAEEKKKKGNVPAMADCCVW